MNDTPPQEEETEAEAPTAVAEETASPSKEPSMSDIAAEQDALLQESTSNNHYLDPKDVDVDRIRYDYEQELENERRKAGQRVAITILVMMMMLIPLFASM